MRSFFLFFFQAEDGIRDSSVTGSSDVCSSDLRRPDDELREVRARGAVRLQASPDGNGRIPVEEQSEMGPGGDHEIRFEVRGNLIEGDPGRGNAVVGHAAY